MGFSIPFDVIGEGLSLPHYGTIVNSIFSKIGKNARIHIRVNIGESNGGAHIIGHNIYIGLGEKLFGKITLGNNVIIVANAAVNKSFEEDNIVLAGVLVKIVEKIEILK